MEIGELQLRNVIPFEHFISIRFSVEFPTVLTGHLIYIREPYKNYKLTKGDEIDQAILNGIKTFASRAEVSHRTTLYTDQNLQEALHINRGGAQRGFVFYFFPIGDINFYNKLSKKEKLRAIPKELRMTFWTHDQSIVDGSSVLRELIVNVPQDAMKLLKTLKKV